MSNIFKIYILRVLSFLLPTLGYCGTPSLASHSLTSLNSPIIVGQEVYFISAIDRISQCQSDIQINIDFGPFAPNQNFTFTTPGSSTESIGPIIFSSPGSLNVTQTAIGPCQIIPSATIIEQIEILALPPIPTLSQWGLIIFGFFFMIFGVVFLKRQSTEQVKLS